MGRDDRADGGEEESITGEDPVIRYFAHSANKVGGAWEPLREHVRSVAKRAAEYADSFGAKDEAIVAGLWHDLGKYSELFARRLKGEVRGLDHWSPGALAALVTYKERSLAAALAIQGHHIGLQEGSRQGIRTTCDLSTLSDQSRHPLGLTLSDSNVRSLIERFKEDGLKTPSAPAASLYDFARPPGEAMLDCRMLFSALVDADVTSHVELTEEGSVFSECVG